MKLFVVTAPLVGSAEKLVLAGATAINPADGAITNDPVITLDGGLIQSISSGGTAPSLLP